MRGPTSQEPRRVVARYFGEEARHWRELYDHADFNGRNFRARAEAGLAWLRELPRDGGWVLDLGCGAGLQAAAAARLGWRVVGADFSLPILRMAAGEYDGPRWAAGDGLSLPFRTGQFDAVMMNGVIGWSDDAPRLLEEARRCLAPGGHLIISWVGRPVLLDIVSHACSTLPDVLYSWAKRVITRRAVGGSWPPGMNDLYGHYWNESDFCNELADAGFSVTDVRAINFGQFRFVGHALWSESVDLTLSRTIERVASWAPFAFLRNYAKTHVALARKPG